MKTTNDALENRMKAYENQTCGINLIPRIPVIARLDGKGFSKFTKGLKRPYDERLSNLMIETTKYLVKETNANCGYTQSDEITLVWYTDKIDSSIYFKNTDQLSNLEFKIYEMISEFCRVNIRDEQIEQILN